MLETAGRLLTIVVLATAIALAPQEIQAQSGSKPTAPDAPPVGAPAGVTCQGNTIYIVCVNTATSSALGRYTARTASGHPSPGQNLLFGGARESPGTTFNSYRSFTSGTTYTQGSVSGAINPDTVTPTFSLIGTTGVRTTWNVTTPDRLRIVQDVNVVGSTLTDSAVEVTTTITNTGTSSVAVGMRYLWDYQISVDDGPTFQQRSPDGPVLTRETEFRPPNFQFYAITNNEGTITGYTVFGTALGPSSLQPPPTAPTQVSYASWPSSVDTAFDYTTTNQEIAGPGGINDSAVLYWWGRDAASAIQLAANASTTNRALIFASSNPNPPIFTPTPTPTPRFTFTATPTATRTVTLTPTPTSTPPPVVILPPPPPPLQFTAPPPLLPPLLPPPVGAPQACCPPRPPMAPLLPEVPVIPEADTLLLAAGGLAALAGTVGWRKLRERRR